VGYRINQVFLLARNFANKIRDNKGKSIIGVSRGAAAGNY